MEHDEIGTYHWEWRVIEIDQVTGRKHLFAPYYTYGIKSGKSRRNLPFTRQYYSRDDAIKHLKAVGLLEEAQRGKWLCVRVDISDIFDPFTNESLLDKLT